MPPQNHSSPLEGYKFAFEAHLNSSDIEAASDPSGDGIYDSQSLSESISKSHKQFGRTYHSYRAGSYHYPNDPSEAERLDEQYEVIKEVMDGRLHFAPFSRAKPPRKVLDIATGTGTWAIDLGDEFPGADIMGTDLSPIQPPFVPPGVRFFIEDSTEDWDYRAEFDYIHTRITLGCWEDMKTQIVQRAFDHLQPGGFFECQEIMIEPCCDDGTMPDEFGWLKWSRDVTRASELAGKQLKIGEQLKDWLEEVGFVDVHETIIKIPIGGWPRDMRLKQIGMLWQRLLLDGLSGFSLGLFHRFLGKTVEEIEASSPPLLSRSRGFHLAIDDGEDADVAFTLGFSRWDTAKPFQPESPFLPQVIRRMGAEARGKRVIRV